MGVDVYSGVMMGNFQNNEEQDEMSRQHWDKPDEEIVKATGEARAIGDEIDSAITGTPEERQILREVRRTMTQGSIQLQGPISHSMEEISENPV